MKFVLLINLKIQTIANYFSLNIAEHENFSANKYEIPTIYVLSRNMKISEFLSENFHFLVVKFSLYLNRLLFVMHLIGIFS